MSLYVKGIRINADELAEKYVFDFNKLNASGQKRIFLENKNLFFGDSLKSKYKTVRNLAIQKKEEVSSKTVNEVIKNIVLKGDFYNSDLVIELLKSKDFKLDKNNRERLASTEYWEIRKIIAKDKNTPLKVLEKMFIEELYYALNRNCTVVMEDIVRNPKFKIRKNVMDELKSRYSSKKIEEIIQLVIELNKK